MPVDAYAKQSRYALLQRLCCFLELALACFTHRPNGAAACFAQLYREGVRFTSQLGTRYPVQAFIYPPLVIHLFARGLRFPHGAGLLV